MRFSSKKSKLFCIGCTCFLEESTFISPRVFRFSHKAIESYKCGLAIDPTNAACKDGMRKVQTLINYASSTMTEEEKMERARHGMADPEIQAILTDPVIQQILKDFNENPQAANQAMANPVVRAKIEKLIASGVVQTA